MATPLLSLRRAAQLVAKSGETDTHGSCPGDGWAGGGSVPTLLRQCGIFTTLLKRFQRHTSGSETATCALCLSGAAHSDVSGADRIHPRLCKPSILALLLYKLQILKLIPQGITLKVVVQWAGTARADVPSVFALQIADPKVNSAILLLGITPKVVGRCGTCRCSGSLSRASHL